jgi:Integrase core domain
LRSMGIRDKPTAPASPWQNGFAERLIGSIRRECVDHIIVLGEMHLRRVLKSYADYYNSVRTHRSLNKDAPVTRQIQRIGSIKSHAILGGLSPPLRPSLVFGTRPKEGSHRLSTVSVSPKAEIRNLPYPRPQVPAFTCSQIFFEFERSDAPATVSRF